MKVGPVREAKAGVGVPGAVSAGGSAGAFGTGIGLVDGVCTTGVAVARSCAVMTKRALAQEPALRGAASQPNPPLLAPDGF